MRNLGKTYISRLMRVVAASVAVVLAPGHERGGRLARERCTVAVLVLAAGTSAMTSAHCMEWGGR